MGTYYYEKRHNETMLEFISRHEFSGCKVVASSIKLTQAYFACELGDQSVIGVVVLIYRDHKNGTIGLKVMEESMGPFNYQAPNKLIDLLTPTNCEASNRWRQSCRDYNAHTATLNKVLQEDLSGARFSYGQKVYEIVRKDSWVKNQWIVMDIESGIEYRMKKSKFKAAKFITGTEVQRGTPFVSFKNSDDYNWRCKEAEDYLDSLSDQELYQRLSVVREQITTAYKKNKSKALCNLQDHEDAIIRARIKKFGLNIAI